MPLRVGILSCAHMHVYGYAHGLKSHPDAEIVGLWDDVPERAETFAQKTGIPFVGFMDDLLASVDAAAKAGKQILCEKPLGASEEHLKRIENAVQTSGVTFMTAFPCRFSPAY